MAMKLTDETARSAPVDSVLLFMCATSSASVASKSTNTGVQSANAKVN